MTGFHFEEVQSQYIRRWQRYDYSITEDIAFTLSEQVQSRYIRRWQSERGENGQTDRQNFVFKQYKTQNAARIILAQHFACGIVFLRIVKLLRKVSNQVFHFLYALLHLLLVCVRACVCAWVHVCVTTSGKNSLIVTITDFVCM